MPIKDAKAVLFDLDGVLVDSFDTWLTAFNMTLKKFGAEAISKKDFRKKYWGNRVEANIKEFEALFKNAALGRDAAEYCKKKHEELSAQSNLFPDAKKVLAEVKKKFKTALVTNTPGNEVRKLLDDFRIKKYFDVVVTGDDVRHGKPDPEMILKACKMLDVKPGEAVVVGDTKTDFLAGRGAGCKVVGMGMDADFRIQRLSELIGLLD